MFQKAHLSATAPSAGSPLSYNISDSRIIFYSSNSFFYFFILAKSKLLLPQYPLETGQQRMPPSLPSKGYRLLEFFSALGLSGKRCKCNGKPARQLPASGCTQATGEHVCAAPTTLCSVGSGAQHVTAALLHHPVQWTLPRLP